VRLVVTSSLHTALERQMGMQRLQATGAHGITVRRSQFS
jgi:hypothetical protein